jgi:hypothetical protein
VSIEYEVDSASHVLSDVVITIPLAMYFPPEKISHRPGTIPDVKEVDGDYQVTSAGLEWIPPVNEVENGRLEFNAHGDDAEMFFPVQVRYKTAKTVCSVDVCLLGSLF